MQNTTSFDPRRMLNQETDCITRAKNLIQSLFDLNILPSTAIAKREYELFNSGRGTSKKYHFSSFDKDKQQLDAFLGKYISGNVDYVNFWKVCKMVLILLHCQAGVERGFSVYKELLTKNMQKASIISQIIIFDQISCRRVEQKKIGSDSERKCKLICEKVDEITKKKQYLGKFSKLSMSM